MDLFQLNEYSVSGFISGHLPHEMTKSEIVFLLENVNDDDNAAAVDIGLCACTI